MNTLQAILERRSIRKYRREPLPKEHLQQILEAGRQAPSAANRQPWHVIVVEDAEQRRQLADACNGQLWMADAAYILVALGSPETSSKWYKLDIGIALQNTILMARNLGYGTCWIGAFDAAKVKEICQVPDGWEAVVCVPLGVPDECPAARERKAWGEIFSAGHFGKALPE